ncbi:acylglycerol lipase [Azospirillaceae bacterium]
MPLQTSKSWFHAPKNALRPLFVNSTSVILGLLTLSGCAASFQPMEAATTSPVMTADAIIAADGYRLPLRRWTPTQSPRGVILALHGFNDYANAFEGPGGWLAEHGFQVYAYDQRGFGATSSPGVWSDTETMVADLDAAAGLIQANHPQTPFYLLGESMGGAVVIAALTSAYAERSPSWSTTYLGPPPLSSERVAGVILSAPAVWGRKAMALLPRLALWIAYNFVPGMELVAPKELKIRPSDNIEMLRALGRDPLILKETRVDAMHGLVDLMGVALEAAPRFNRRSLILYGAHEEVLPPAPIVRFLNTLPKQSRAESQRTVVTYPNGWHMLMRDLQADVVLHDLLSWLTQPDRSLPSLSRGHV